MIGEAMRKNRRATNPPAPWPEQRPGVTVVVATYNRAPYLPDALRSILAQTVPPTRIVVIDDGSTDGTVDALAPFVDRVEYLRQENGGKARALNRVLPTVDTEFVWFFDDDDAAHPDAIESLIAPLRDNPAVAFSFGSFSEAHTQGPLLLAERHAVPYPHGTLTGRLQRLALFRACNIMMSGALLRTAAVREIGGFDEGMLRGQDYDMMIRLASRYEHRFCAKEVFVVRVHDAPRGPARESHTHVERGRIWAKYNARIGTRMMIQLPLAAFAPDAGAPSSGAALRAALLTRAWAMATKLGTSVTVSDILSAFEADSRSPLTPPERQVLIEAFNHEFLSAQSHRAALRLLRLLRAPAARSALMLLGKGLYWGALNHASGWRKRMTSGLLGWTLYGAAYLASRGDRQPPTPGGAH